MQPQTQNHRHRPPTPGCATPVAREVVPAAAARRREVLAVAQQPHHCGSMETDEDVVLNGLKGQMSKTYSDFMTRVANFNALVVAGSTLVTDFRHGLEFLRRRLITSTSKLVESIIKANETDRVKSYVHTGCMNSHDIAQNIIKLQRCMVGLQDHLTKAKLILNELESDVDEATTTMQTANKSLQSSFNRNYEDVRDQQDLNHCKEVESYGPPKPHLTDYAALMAIVYSMMKQDYLMQERIVNALNLKSPSGELDSYTFMWSLRPFINEEVMQEAWSVLP